MNKMSVNDVCRLCLTKDDLVWIFDKRLENSENMKDVIYITTGVEISIKDIVSQRICKKCCEVTIKMFEFRRTSLKNDKQLREDCNRNLKEKYFKIPNTEVTIIKNKLKTDVTNENHKMKEQSQEPEKLVFKVHPSIRDLFKVYPQIKLPTVCLKSPIAPFVSLQLDKVEDYFKKRKLDMNEHIKLVLRSSKTATKNATVPIRSKTASFSLPDINEAVQRAIIKNEHPLENLLCLVKINQRKPGDEVQIQRNYELQSKQNHEAQSKESHEVQNKQTGEAQGKQNQEVQSKPNNDAVNENSGKSIDKIKISEKLTSEKSSEYKKRKFSDIESSSEKHSNKKPAFVESLELAPKINVVPSTTATGTVYVANVSEPLHICNICNSVQYNAKDLRKHQDKKHLRCQFCKTLFRTLETKKRHIESTCIIKNTMTNLPDVEAEKIDYNREVRMKYPEAFIDFPPLEGVHNNLDNIIKVPEPISQSSKDVKYSCNDSNPLTPPKPLKSSVSGNELEVIEIISDDEEPPVSAANNSTSASIHKKSVNKVIEKPVSNANGDRIINEKDKVATIPVVGYSKVPTATLSIDNFVYNTVSIVKPEIRIKDNHILDTMDPKLPDKIILKELLIFKPLQLTADINVQTDLPSNRSITINKNDAGAELQQLKPQMYVYKIPVVIKNGPFTVCYKYRTEAKQPKRLCLWNDLTPIDIKVNNIRVLNSDKGSRPLEDPNNRLQNSDNSASLSPCEEKTGTENNNAQLNNDSSTPTISTKSSLVSNLPSRSITTTPKYICIDRNVIDSTLSLASANIINMNPLLNNFLQTPVSTTVVPSSIVVPSSNTETLVCNNVVPGTIRVKNVWELT